MTESKFNIRILAISMALFSFWDFYLPSLGIRPLDITGFVLLTCVIIYCATNRQKFASLKYSQLPFIVLLAVLFLWPCLTGLERNAESLKPSMAIVAGLVTFTSIFCLRIRETAVVKIIDGILSLHIVFFVLYAAFYFTTGNILNIFSFLDTEPRAYAYGGSFVRFVGAFLEPANYALTVISLLVLRFRYRKNLNTTTVVSLITVAGSLSFWGIVATILFLVMCRFLNLRFFWIPMVVVFVFYASYDEVQLISEGFDSQHPLYRLYHLDTDTSAIARYTSFLTAHSVNENEILFGRGAGADYLDFGTNGLYYLLNLFGVVGIACFVLIILGLAKSGTRFFVLLGIFLCLTAAPLITYFFWWAWLSLLLKPEFFASAQIYRGSSTKNRQYPLRGFRLTSMKP